MSGLVHIAIIAGSLHDVMQLRACKCKDAGSSDDHATSLSSGRHHTVTTLVSIATHVAAYTHSYYPSYYSCMAGMMQTIIYHPQGLPFCKVVGGVCV